MGFAPEPDGQGPIIVSTTCNFRRELAYPGTVLVRHYVGEVGTSSFQTYLDLCRTDDPATVHADGSARVVWVDFPKKKSAPLPPEVRAAILRPRGTLV